MFNTELESSIYAACIARQVFDHIKRVSDAPKPDDFDRFHDEAGAVTAQTLEAIERAFKDNRMPYQ
jgi:hypothetical protein